MNEKILIIDDEKDILTFLDSILTDEGFQVRSALRGEEAIEIFKSAPFDLVITDIRMPGMDGLEVVRQIKQTDKDMEIIILTGHATLEDAIQALRDDGAYDYLKKPLEDIDKLFIAVSEALERRRFCIENKKLVTELRESEERYREIVEGTDDLITRVDSEGRFIYLNHMAEKIFGVRQEECIGMSAFDFIHPDDRNRTMLWFNEFVAKHQTNGTIENRQVNKKTEKIHVMFWTFNFDYDEKGNLMGVKGIARDLTDYKSLEARLMQVQKMEAIGTLAAGIAHDYNNLLTAIMGNIFLAKSYFKSDDEVFGLLNEAGKASMSAKDLTQKLITFSRGGTPVKKTICISQLLKDTVELALSGSNIKYKFFIPDNLWPVEIDEAQIGQVIHLIVINAKEAMPQGGTIAIDSEGVSLSEENLFGLKAGEYVKVSVKDTGVGIPELDLDRIFDPYFSTKERGIQKGMGLGLSISHSIIKNHRGAIVAESEVGIGTTIYFYLPVGKKSSVKKKHVKQPAKDKIVKGKGKILVMDDEKMVRDVAGKMLCRFGYDVKFSADGSEAIEMYKNAMDAGEPFAAVIMDLTIRDGIGGKEAIGKLLEIDPNVKGIVYSGYSNDPAMTDFKAHGFRGVLSKPFTMKQLSELMQNIFADD